MFNGGGKLEADGLLIDIHYRDLGAIDRIHHDAERGEFTITSLLFHQAGLPSYLLLAELALNQTLRGTVPRWGYPEALRESAPLLWWHQADLTLQYAEEGHARHGRVAQCAGLVSEAACQAAHGILARRGAWITNEKRLLDESELRGIDAVVAEMTTQPEGLMRSVRRARELVTSSIHAARSLAWRA